MGAIVFNHKKLREAELTGKKNKEICHMGVSRFMMETEEDIIKEIVIEGIVSRMKFLLGFSEKDTTLIAKAFKTEGEAESDILDKLKRYDSRLSCINRKFVISQDKNDLPNDAYWIFTFNCSAKEINQLIEMARKESSFSNVNAIVNVIIEKIDRASDKAGNVIVRDMWQPLKPLDERLTP